MLLKMKNLSTMMVVLPAISVIMACNNKAKNYNKMADSANIDSVSTAQDTSTTINLAVDKDDSQFAIEAASGGLTEVALGKLAIQKGSSKKVKNFGTMMVKDHSKANDKLMVLIKAKNITLPVIPNAKDQSIIDSLSKKSGKDFDKAYINDMIVDHQNDVKLFTAESKQLQDPDLKNFAKKNLPVLQNHLDAINAIHDSMR